MELATVAEVERAIAGALTPAFLLAGIGGLLNVMSQRRNRIVDRLLEAHEAEAHPAAIASLRLRARLALLAMQACILSGVIVCALVVVAFIAQLYAWQAGPEVTALMVTAMATLALGLLAFLAEATLARTDLPPFR